MTMGLFDFIFGNRKPPQGRYGGEFKLLDGYSPHFTSFSGGLYESEKVRAAINVRAVHISKLHVETFGSAKPSLQRKLSHAPNVFQSWSQFLYRASTILDIHNTLFIVPILDEYGAISGLYTPLPSKTTIVEFGGIPYLRYEFRWGDHAAIELDQCAIMTKFQYRNDLLGEPNKALFPTMELINMQNQGIQEGVKSSATYRFWGRLQNFAKPEDVAKERKRFTEQNFSRESDGGGMLLFPNTYTDIHQVDTKPWVVDAETMEIINKNVYEHFGVNEDILENRAYGDAWAAFYEGAVEPFAIQFSEVVTKMLFTLRERSEGNIVMATSSRLQYMSNADKLAVSAQMADRGLMTRNEIREIWNLSPLPEPFGSQLPIRGEYYNVNEEEQSENEQGNTDV